MIETKFKETEVGKIPEDWEVKSLASLIDECGYGIGAESVNFDGINKYLRITDIDDKSHNFKPSPLVSPSIIDDSYIAKKDDLFIARTGASVGKSYLYNKKDGRLYYAGFLIKVHIKHANSIIVFYNTLTERYNRWVISESARTGQPGINAIQLKSLKIILPKDRSEQNRIADILSNIDVLISQLDKLIEKKRAIKQGAMQELLTGQKRLRGFSEPWVEKKLDDVLKYEQPTGYLVTSTEYFDSGIPVLTAGKTFILGYTHETKGVYNKVPVIIFDDFVTESKYVTFPFKAKSSAMKMLSLRNPKDNLRFIYEVMQTINFPMTDHKRYWISEYSQQSIWLPEPAEQTEIANVIATLESEISSLESKRLKYIAIKQGMMQQLLTGKIRLI